MIKDFKPRLYQQTILGTTTAHNTLVVLPTGMGKTAVFLMLAAHRLTHYPNGKILFVGPTRPLIDQYYEVFTKHTTIPKEKLAILTGNVKPEKRHQMWEDSTIIFSTPQGLENDVLSGKISLKEVVLFGFDEAHRAVGNYAYVFLAKQYHKQTKHERILALTASPGDNVEKIEEICKHLFIKEIELRTGESPDVAPYIQEVAVEKIVVDLPIEFLETQKFLQEAFNSKLSEVRKLGYLQGAIKEYNKGDLLRLQGALHGKIAQGERDFDMLRSISLIAEGLKLHHAIELLETQDPGALLAFMKKLQAEGVSGKTKASANLVRDISFRSAFIKAQTIIEKNIEHPKLTKLKEIIKKNKDKKIIVFSQYRDMGQKIVAELGKEKIKSSLFVGQQKKRDTGLSQKEQKAMIQAFSKGEFSVLVSSSVGEEGLDIPQVDLVMFYEPVPSAIRKIQRSGRTGRLEKGQVIILSTRNTKDEAYHFVSIRKEKRMQRAITNVKSGLAKKPFLESLKSFVSKSDEDTQKLTIIADHREKNSGVLKVLVDKNVTIQLSTLKIGDYLLGNDVVVEYKTVQDFVNSIIDGRLLSQLKQLKQYPRPLLIIEGVEDMYAVRKVHHKAIQGMLATIVTSYGVPILQTRNPKETADLFEIIAKREQLKGDISFTQHSGKPLTLKEQQEYVVASFPGIGGTLNKPLLEHFKSIQNIINADLKELQKVDLIGPKKAKSLKELFEEMYME